MIYTLTLNPALDYVMHPINVCEGTTNRSEKEEISFGGKGINVSYVLKELGVRSVALGFVGGFTGDALEESLDKVGVHHDFVRLAKGLTRINVKIKTDVETEINGKGPSITEKDYARLLDKLKDISSDDCLVIAGSVPQGLPLDTYENIAQMMTEKGVRLILDVSGYELRRLAKYKPFLVKPNIKELSEFYGKTIETEDELIEAYLDAKGQGVENVLVSMGEKGAVLADRNGNIHRIKAPKIACKNSVGAGDSMVAGFLAGYCEGIEEAFKLAVASGTATAASDSLALLYEINEMLIKVDVLNKNN